MRLRIGLVVAAMALALGGQWLAIVVVAPQDSPIQPQVRAPLRSSQARPFRPRDERRFGAHHEKGPSGSP
jgi:hypothetical protein